MELLQKPSQGGTIGKDGLRKTSPGAPQQKYAFVGKKGLKDGQRESSKKETMWGDYAKKEAVKHAEVQLQKVHNDY